MTIADSGYRAVMYSLENTVRPIGIYVPLILMTATMPSAMERDLLSKFSCSDAVVIRDSTVRPNIAYKVQIIKRNPGKTSREAALKEVLSACMQSISTIYESREARIIVYVLTKRFADEICDTLNPLITPDGALKYHSDLSIEERQKA